MLLAVPLGMWQAVRRNKPVDYVITTLSFIAYSTPVYFLGLILVLVFSQVLPWFPSQAPQGDTLAQVFSQPAGAGAAGRRRRRLDDRGVQPLHAGGHPGEPLRGLRPDGAGRRFPLPRHPVAACVPQLADPGVAMLGYYVPVLFGGALVVEQLFNYPGMGLLFWTAAQSSDYPVLLGCVLVISVATVVGTLLADIVQRIIDPRVKAGRA